MTSEPGTVAAGINDGFDATAFEHAYDFLDECPDRFLDAVVALPIGNLPERVIGICAWRDAFLDGRLPAVDGWPGERIAAPVRQALETLGLVQYCKDEPELVDDLLEDIVAAFSRHHHSLRADVARRLRELENLERVKRRGRREDIERKVANLAEQWGTTPHHRKHGPESFLLDDETVRGLREQAERELASSVRDADARLIEVWEERVRGWAEIARVFGDLGNMLGRGWDLTTGVMRHTGWRDLLALRQLVERLPQFQEIVRTLGRLHFSETAESVAERVFVPMRRLEEERIEVWTPLVAGETRGIERSGSIANMLPVEAAMLGHPKLRLLWHARRSDQALLTYRVEGVDTERTLVEKEVDGEAEIQRRRRERGPIIAVIDTSGSMHGLPEQIAKALVLEALRTAHAEKRRCCLFTFGGPGQTVELELDLSREGVGRLLEFLSFSFGGGSDPTEAITGVLRRIEDSEWAKADALLVSDGEWPAPPSLTDAVQRARKAGTRIHGIQIGNRGPTGLHDICEPTHVFANWIDVAYGSL